MIGAGEGCGIAGVGPAQSVAAMPADIEKGMDLVGTVAHHQNRVFAHIGGQKVAGPRDLTLMTEE